MATDQDGNKLVFIVYETRASAAGVSRHHQVATFREADNAARFVAESAAARPGLFVRCTLATTADLIRARD